MSIVLTANKFLVGSMREPMRNLRSTRKASLFLRRLKLSGKTATKHFKLLLMCLSLCSFHHFYTHCWNKTKM
ncbi:hypothetical protein VIGAN_08151500, partial [Vigna angularis var. angularis]